jgi:hypothetical protein
MVRGELPSNNREMITPQKDSSLAMETEITGREERSSSRLVRETLSQEMNAYLAKVSL